MRPLFGTLLMICLTAAASAWQSGQNSWATIPRPPRASPSPSSYDVRAERLLLGLANQARRKAGIPPLRFDDGLTQAARKHSALMAANNELSHDLPGEPALPQRLAATSSLQLSAEAENVGLAGSVTQAHQGFMDSPHHRENLLDRDYNVAGFAVVHRGNMIYVTQDFGQALPRHSTQQAEGLVAQSVIRLRRNAALPDLQRIEGSRAESAACSMAEADSLQSTQPRARYVVSYTSMQPEEMPASSAKPIGDPSIRSFAVGTCYSRTKTYPNGAYWIVLLFY